MDALLHHDVHFFQGIFGLCLSVVSFFHDLLDGVHSILLRGLDDGSPLHRLWQVRVPSFSLVDIVLQLLHLLLEALDRANVMRCLRHRQFLDLFFE